MKREAYAAAGTVAPKVHAYFARRLAEARARGVEAESRGQDNLAALPDAAAIEAVIDAAFWASLRREENHTPRISLALVSPEQALHPLLFDRTLPLAPDALAKVAPAVERPGVHLGIWHDGAQLSVWGATRVIPRLCFVLEVTAPGLLVIKHHSGEEAGKFVNVAVLEGDLIKVVDQQASTQRECPALLTSLLGVESPAAWAHSVNVLLQMAVSMRAHARGGALLVVPAGSEAWRESVVRPIAYAVSPPFLELAELNRETPIDADRRVWQEAIGRTVDWIAGLTAVDGATVIDDQFRLLGFGAKIIRRHGSDPVSRVMVTEPIAGAPSTVVHPEQLGGTGHLSAAQFAHDQRDAGALVASQDGRFTIFEWSRCEEMVHARRLESLLL